MKHPTQALIDVNNVLLTEIGKGFFHQPASDLPRNIQLCLTRIGKLYFSDASILRAGFCFKQPRLLHSVYNFGDS